jgi:osmotically-inducible protein OsmY
VRSDSDVQRAVEAELCCHPNVDDTDIVVSVKKGVVTLSGYVRNLFQKYGAEDAVKRVAGVAAVANDIDLQRGLRGNVTDPEIARDSVAALRRVLPLCSERVRPVVRHGTVTLEGMVNSPEQREAAEDAVRRLKQVLAVINALTLADGADVNEPREITRRIQECLRRGGRLDPSAITIETQGADVTLRGSVSTWPEHLEAEECARAAPGVRQVRNELVVTAAIQRGPGSVRSFPNGTAS